MANREKTREVFIELINLQLEPHNKKYEDVADVTDWYMQYNTTRKKEQQFIEKAIQILRTKLKMSKSVAEKEINWFILQWGLTTNSNQEETENVLIEKESKTTKRTKK
jgi:hypothetical protein